MLRAVEIYPWATLLTAVILWFVVAIPMDKIVKKLQISKSISCRS